MGIKLNPFSGMLDITGSGGGGSPVPADRYAATFSVGDWVLNAPDYEITVAESTHSKGSHPVVVVYEGTTTFEEVGIVVTVNNIGDVTIKVSNSPDNRFAGLIIIQ